MKRKIILVSSILAVIGIVVLFRLLSNSHTVDKPCDWCGKSPSVAYETSDETESYVCDDCSKVCTWCGEKAVRHYENGIGMIVFVCDDCYKDIN